MQEISEPIRKRFDEPDETREFKNGRSEILHLGDTTVARFTFEPGWKWSEDIKPVVGTDSCEVFHTGIIMKGRLGTRMDDGTEFELGPGEATVIPPGHDGWVVGDEPLEFLDITGAEKYAKEK